MDNSIFLWDWNTFILLLLVIFMASILAGISVKRIVKNDSLNTVSVQFKVRTFPLVLSYIILVMVSGLQTSGIDIENYRYLYEVEISNGLNLLQIEPLFKLIYFIAYKLFKDFQGVVLLSSALTYGFLYVSLIRYKRHYNFGLLIFGFTCLYLLVGFTLLRQMIAVSIFLFSLRYIECRKPIRFLICILLASLFHISALICIPCYWFCTNTKGIKSNLVFIFSIPFFLIVLMNISSIFNFFISKIFGDERYFIYVESLNIGLGNIILRMPLIAIVYFLRKMNPNTIFHVSRKLVLYDLVLSFLYYYLPILNRCSYYFQVSYLFIISSFCIYVIKDKYLRHLAIVLIFICIFVFQLLCIWWLRNPIMPIKFYGIS